MFRNGNVDIFSLKSLINRSPALPDTPSLFLIGEGMWRKPWQMGLFPPIRALREVCWKDPHSGLCFFKLASKAVCICSGAMLLSLTSKVKQSISWDQGPRERERDLLTRCFLPQITEKPYQSQGKCPALIKCSLKTFLPKNEWSDCFYKHNTLIPRSITVIMLKVETLALSLCDSTEFSYYMRPLEHCSSPCAGYFPPCWLPGTPLMLDCKFCTFLQP